MAWELEALDSLDEAAIGDILESWAAFCDRTTAMLAPQGGGGRDGVAIGGPDDLFIASVTTLCDHGLFSLVQDHFIHSLEEALKANVLLESCKQIDASFSVPASGISKSEQENWIEEVLCEFLEHICVEKHHEEKCLLMLIQALQSHEKSLSKGYMDMDQTESSLFSRYQLMVSSVILTTLPWHFPEILCMYFKQKLEELSSAMAVNQEDASEFQTDDILSNQQDSSSTGVGDMDIDGCVFTPAISMNDALIHNIGKVVLNLRRLGLISMTEDAYASAIFLLLKAKVCDVAGDDYRNPLLDSIREWIQAVPLKFLHALLAYLGEPSNEDMVSSLKSPLAVTPYPGNEIPSEGLIRWKLRLEYFAYETLQDLRIGKLFEIIVDYPDSSPAIEDLKQCLEYTGQHSKLVDSFISSLRYRLLTAGASTHDILHQYVSTIKALRTIDPTGVFLEAVGEPIRDYLRGRKDTIKCIVTMLTDGTGGNSSGTGSGGDSLLEELNRDTENQESVDYDDDVINSDDKQAWTNAERWEPDPLEADPAKGSRSRRRIDILGMIVSVIGSKDQLVNEYRVMLAERLLSKSDYDIDSEIRTLELLKIHFGETSMQKCEIMVNDLIDSKRTNANIKASLLSPSFTGSQQRETNLSLDIVDSTIISSNFWPPIQVESLNIPAPIDQLLSDYANRFHEIKTPRKLGWKKNLGTVKLELQFEDRNLQFTVSPMHAVIIMHFQEQTSWTSKNLAAAVGVPVDTLNRRINFWISKGILVEANGPDSDDHIFTIVHDMNEANRTATTNVSSEGLLTMDEEADRSAASVEEQLQKEMIVFENFIVGMLTNVGSMTLDKIHNTLKMFCIAELSYDKSLQQLQSFLSGLVSEEKLEMRDGSYFLKK